MPDAHPHPQKKILVVFGTRPEIIKLAPVIFALRKSKTFKLITLSTGQHKHMLQQFLDIFGIEPDIDLAVMKQVQTLDYLTQAITKNFATRLDKIKPDLVMVQGDTTTAFLVALTSFYRKIPVAHVEAGLRTGDIYNPFPEEVNRRFIDNIASFYFAPTKMSEQNLLHEGAPRKRVFVTGNTVVDTLQWLKKHQDLNDQPVLHHYHIAADDPYILVTIHRRESLGRDLKNMFSAIKQLARANRNYSFVYPVHLNPLVKEPAEAMLGAVPNIRLLPPLDYLDFVRLMNGCHFVMTDSGGIAEEAPSFKKPVLILRDKTERMEAIAAGLAQLTGTETNAIVAKAQKLIDSPDLLARMTASRNPFGDGTASQKIVKILREHLV
ncbi:MAG: UDP-N-acetylglucosamine 2-epimerase [Parcubacteria group bacterium RIFCSPHIGHO2_01_FULL_47_10b]|nr:MAG: UDP-N-acetylglucosamine 2-epimerase [Parcubacteria group bacterium RIFCSPHIGHO2_01_FULL_47_10b]